MQGICCVASLGTMLTCNSMLRVVPAVAPCICLACAPLTALWVWQTGASLRLGGAFGTDGAGLRLRSRTTSGPVLMCSSTLRSGPQARLASGPPTALDAFVRGQRGATLRLPQIAVLRCEKM